MGQMFGQQQPEGKPPPSVMATPIAQGSIPNQPDVYTRYKADDIKNYQQIIGALNNLNKPADATPKLNLPGITMQDLVINPAFQNRQVGIQ